MAVKKFSLEAVIDLTDKMTKPMQNIEKSMTGFSKKMQKNFGGVGKDIKALDAGINKVAKGIAIGTVAIGAGAIMVGKSFIEAGAEVEKYKTTLTTMLGSQELANKRFEEMSKFAASTPFELNEVVALGNQLQALGMYSVEAMTTLGDLAAASGKPIDQVTNAFAKLVSGQKGEAVNMFRDLLISTKDWQAATGKGIKKTGELMATTDEMIAALPKILAAKGFTGMMDNLSRTNEGISSNFKDTVTRFKQGVGGILLPAWNKFLLVMTKVVSAFSDTFNAQGARYVDMIAKGIEDLAKWIETIDIGKALGEFIEFVKTAWNVLKVIKAILPFLLIFAAEIKIVTAVMAVYAIVQKVVETGAKSTTVAMFGIMAGIALLVVAIIWLVKNWDKVVVVLGVVYKFIKDNITTILESLSGALVALTVVMAIMGITNPFVVIATAVVLLSTLVLILAKNWSSVVAVLKVVGSAVGGFFVGAWELLIKALAAVSIFLGNIGDSLWVLVLTPINMIIDAVKGLIGLMSKLPVLGEKMAPAIDALNGFQSGMNMFATGSANAYDLGGVWQGGYSNPDTRVAETRSSTSSTTRSEVFVRPDTGATVSDTRGGAPRFNLAYGAAQ